MFVISGLKDLLHPSEAKLRSMYRLGVQAGIQQQKQVSGGISRIHDRMPVTPVVLSQETVRTGALARAHHNTLKVTILDAKASSSMVIPTRPTIRWKQPPAMLLPVQLEKHIAPVSDRVLADHLQAPTLLVPSVKRHFPDIEKLPVEER